MGSASEDEDDDDPPHLRGPALGLGVLGPNGPDSAGGPLGTSDISVQSMSTDSKNTHDDSDQVSSLDKHRMCVWGAKCKLTLYVCVPVSVVKWIGLHH